MQVKKIKLKLKEKKVNSRQASFKHNALKQSETSKDLKGTNIYQNIITADSFSISQDFERDARRYFNMQEATL